MLNFDAKAARQAWTYGGVILIIGVIYLIRKTLFVFAISLMFAYLLSPLVDAIDHRLRWKTSLPAMFLSFALMLCSLVGFSWFIKEPASSEAKQLFELVQSRRLSDWTPFGLPLGEQLVEHLSEIVNLVAQFSVGRGLGHAAAGLINLFAVPILSFLLLKDGRAIRDTLLEFLGIGPASETFLRDAHVLLLDYMRAVLILCMATLISYSLALSLLRVRYAILLAFCAFVLEFIPIIGPFSAAAAILITAWFTGATASHILVIASFLLGYRAWQDYILAPILMRRGVQLHPLLVMFGVFAGADIGGVVGVLLSVPILALIRLVCYEVRKNRRHDQHSLEPVGV